MKIWHTKPQMCSGLRKQTNGYSCDKSYTLLSIHKTRSLLSLRDEAMDLWKWQMRKKKSRSQPDPDFKHKEKQRWSQERTVTLQKERRIGFALSAFVVHVCELWLKTEDSLSTLRPFCPIVSRPLPYPPAQKIQTAAQSSAHRLYFALSEWAGPVQTEAHKDQRNYAQALVAEEA